MAHDWTITSPAIGNRTDGVIVVTCRACGETGTFAAMSELATGHSVDLQGVCTPRSAGDEFGLEPLVERTDRLAPLSVRP